MNVRIENGHKNILLTQQERLFAQAASELPPSSRDDFARQAAHNSSGFSAATIPGPQEQVAFVDLGLTPNHTIQDVRKKFKELALLYHPDRSTKDTTEIFRRVVSARETLEKWFDKLKHQ